MKSKPRSTVSRFLTTLAGAASLALLAACGTEAPPCNDPTVTGSILELIVKAHDDNLKGVPFKSKDLATFAMEAPELTGYDDKLKTRSCKVTYSVQASAERVPQMSRYMNAVTSPVVSMLGSLGGLSTLAALGGSDPRAELQAQQADVAQFVAWNQGPLNSDPVRKSVDYRIQKEEGGKDFYVRTNVDVTGSIQYLRIAAQADMQSKRQAATADRAAKEATQKQAEIDRLSASGTWRKAIHILDFQSGHNDPYYCDKNELYCIRGRDEKDASATAYYELDLKGIDEKGRNALEVAQRSNQPVCLVGLQKTQDPQIFRAKGYSTYRNDKGEAVDCLPGAEKTNWDEQVAKTRTEQAAVQQPASTAPSAAAPRGQSGEPADLMSVISRFEKCGEEALCLYTARGNTVYMNMATLEKKDYALLERSVQGRQPLCLREVTQDGKEFTAESLAERC